MNSSKLKIKSIPLLSKPSKTFEKSSLAKNSNQLSRKKKFCILLTAIITTSLISISFSIFSLIYDDLINEYNTSASVAGWIGSLNVGFGQMITVILGPIFSHFSIRLVAMGSCFVCALSYLITFFATNLITIALSFGIFAGVSLSMLITSSFTVAFNSFSEESKTLVGTMVSIGFSIGAILGGVIIRFFPPSWPMKYVFVAYSCSLVQIIPLFLLFYGDNNKRKMVENGLESGNGLEKGGEMEKKRKVEEVYEMDKIKEKVVDGLLVLEINLNENDGKNKPEVNDNNDIMKKMSYLSKNKVNKKNNSSFIYRIKIYLKQILSLILRSSFLSYLTALFFIHIGLNTFNQHSPKRMINLGIPKNSATFFPIVSAAAGLLSKLLVAFIVYFTKGKQNLKLYLFFFASLISGLLQIFLPFFNDFYSIIFHGALEGFFMGIYLCVMSPIMLKLVGMEMVAQGQILLGFFMGAAIVFSTPFAGYLYDKYNYSVVFFVTGSLYLIGSFFQLFSIIISSYNKNNNNNNNNNTEVRFSHNDNDNDINNNSNKK